jgi:hypothetical protein
MSVRAALSIALLLLLSGCGTTRWTDSTRTATEQLLISDAIDRSVSRIDFHVLAGQNVYLDTSFMSTVVDKDYLISSLHQHMLASGCTMKDKKEDADFVVEARAGAVGTDRHDLLFGMPSVNLPWTPATGTPASIPEIALAKRTDQKGVAKVAVFAYHRATGEPVWQSGADTIASKAQDSWWLGIGPIQKGTIYDKAQFAGRDFHVPGDGKKEPEEPRTVRVTRETTFNSPSRFAMHSNDDLSKFGELINSQSPANTLSLAAISQQGYELSPSDPRGIIASPAASWNVQATLNPVGGQGSGAIVTPPSTQTAATTPVPPSTTPTTATPEKTPISRLFGPTRK